MSLAEEIQSVSENAEKSVNYPIGDKLSTFFKQQDESNQTNFVLSGVLIYAAAKIYGRKVDYLEQEIIGIAKNFEALENSEEKQPEKEVKKTRTKKFVIKDGVNLDKIAFDETPVNVLTKVDINKTLAVPSKISRLEKMKEFFTKNRSKTGKIVVPKKLSFMGDFVVSNFGSTQIYDYDDNKEIVGSRRDFVSFSYYINPSTGELQSDICVNNFESDFHIENRENILSPSRSVSPDIRGPSPMDWARPDTPEDHMDTEFIRDPMDPTRLIRVPSKMNPDPMDSSRMIPDPMDPSRMIPDPSRMIPDSLDPRRLIPDPMDPSRLISAPEENTDPSGLIPNPGDQVDNSTSINNTDPTLMNPDPVNPMDPNKLIHDSITADPADLMDTNSLIPDPVKESLDINIDEGIEMDEIHKSCMLLSPLSGDELSPHFISRENEPNVENFVIELEKPVENSEKETENSPIKNVFMIPLRKLKHRCLFDLPNEEYGELKKLKRNQEKIHGDEPMRQMKIFNPFEMMRLANMKSLSEDPPFLGFTRAQQREPITYINYSFLQKAQDAARKYSNDSGVEGRDQTSGSMDLSKDLSVDQTSGSMDLSKDLSMDQTSLEITNKSDDFDTTANTSHNQSQNTSQDTVQSPNISIDAQDRAGDELDNTNINGGDSCYQSLASGESSKLELSSFFKDIESRNTTIDEIEENNDEELNESEERVMQMQQSAINIAKWKEYLKPLLANSEARSKIDMHKYGIEMLEKIGNVNDSKTFDEVTEEGKTPAYFLTMLQLTNNRNIEFDHGPRSMFEPVDTKKIRITVKSKILHQEKFDEMGQQFTIDAMNKVNKLKRKGAETSTPAKRVALNSSISFISANSTDIDEDDELILSQGSSGYCSQTSVLSDF